MVLVSRKRKIFEKTHWPGYWRNHWTKFRRKVQQKTVEIEKLQWNHLFELFSLKNQEKLRIFFGQSGNWNSRLGTTKNRLSASINQNVIKSSSKNKLLSTSGRQYLILGWNCPFLPLEFFKICLKSIFTNKWKGSTSKLVQITRLNDFDLNTRGHKLSNQVQSWYSCVNISPGVVLI